ncbi:hypothetical protein AOLI_G00279130 [Acnodon oligacanthus]
MDSHCILSPRAARAVKRSSLTSKAGTRGQLACASTRYCEEFGSDLSAGDTLDCGRAAMPSVCVAVSAYPDWTSGSCASDKREEWLSDYRRIRLASSGRK